MTNHTRGLVYCFFFRQHRNQAKQQLAAMIAPLLQNESTLQQAVFNSTSKDEENRIAPAETEHWQANIIHFFSV